MATAPADTVSKATDTAFGYVTEIKSAGDQVLATGRQATELFFDLTKKFIDIAVEAAPKLASAPYTPSKKDLQDLLAASYAPVEKVVSMQRAAVAAMIDASGAK